MEKRNRATEADRDLARMADSILIKQNATLLMAYHKKTRSIVAPFCRGLYLFYKQWYNRVMFTNNFA
jgi:hypothetical protein